MATPVPVRSPREFITPEAFRVAEHLIGLRLARPWRRLGAMLIDLLLVVILIKLLDAVAFVIAVVGAFIVFRVSRSGQGVGRRRFYRHGLGCFGALLTFVALLFVIDGIVDLFNGEDAVSGATATIAGDSADAQIRIADSLRAQRLATSGADSAAAALAAVGGDTAFAAARDSVRALKTELAATRAELRQESERRRAVEERFDQGTFGWLLSSISDELGLGLGWLGLYFVAFTVLGRGQTPGKRLLRLRVIRLDGRAIGWWPSLERFGGYYASVFTGLLGFAEMLWDQNRQAFQDKLAHTVVVQEPKDGTNVDGPEETVSPDALPPSDLPSARGETG